MNDPKSCQSKTTLITYISRPPDEILEVMGAKIRGLDDILEVGKMSLDVLDSDIKASSPENIHYRRSNFIEVTLCH